MKAIGIVVEYNPFHNGHKYHLEKAKEEGDIIIAVMSGDFVQRGEPSILNKWIKSEIAIKSGIDIVVELPVFYSTQSAELFSKGAVMLLEKLKVSKMVFGTENGEIEKIKKIIELGKNDEFQRKVKEKMKIGISYPNAYNQTILEYEDLSLQSNEILALEYIKAIENIKSKIVPIAIKRESSGYYSDSEIDGISSATGIRKKIKNGENIEKLISKDVLDSLQKQIKNKSLVELKSFYELIRYRVLLEKESLKNIQDMEEGYWNRLYESAILYDKFEDFFKAIVTKRYTIGRVQRVLIHILTDLTKEITESVKKEVPFIRVLGFNEKGQKYLKALKKIGVRYLTTTKNLKKNLTKKEIELFEFNEKASKIYEFRSGEKSGRDREKNI